MYKYRAAEYKAYCYDSYGQSANYQRYMEAVRILVPALSIFLYIAVAFALNKVEVDMTLTAEASYFLPTVYKIHSCAHADKQRKQLRWIV